MPRHSLAVTAAELLDQAATSPAGRGGADPSRWQRRALKQTALVLRSGVQLAEHEATLPVLRGRLRLVTGTKSWELARATTFRFRLPGIGWSLEDGAVPLTVAATPPS